MKVALRRFRRLVTAAVFATFLLVVVGGVVRVGDSGLGCGPPGSGLRGWPLCHGKLVPSAQLHTVVEYTHRFLAAVVVVLLAAILWQALRRFRAERPLVLGAVAAMLVVVVQAVLGGITVEYGLSTALVAAHLGTAMLLLGILVGLLAAARPRRAAAASARAPLAVAVTACGLLLATIVAGGVMAGTEHHGVPGGEVSEGAHLACGRQFPTCNGSLLPFGSGEMVDIQLAHRTLALLAVAAIAALALLLRRRRLLGRLPIAIGSVLAIQVLLGAANVWLGEHAALVVAHLAVATLLWVLVAGAVAVLASSGTAAAGRREGL
ncbi:MAG: hypothetical protein FVQ78_10450 [Solirubrobacterales bacterium]|nr:hypothetical protein [Solirubrobacterales bacterium]